VAVLIVTLTLIPSLGQGLRISALQGAARFAGAVSSGPLALSADSTLLAVVNPDNNSVSFFDVGNDKNSLLGEVPVGGEPWGVGMTPDGSTVFVANTAQGTVMALKVNKGANPPATLAATIQVGTEPYGVAVTPNGSKLYVTNARSNS
jgi:DNA-binding beta-propeller fold protein YncE